MPGIDGIEAARQIRKESPATKVIALTVHEEDAYVGDALEAGVSAYIAKESALDSLSVAVRAVLKDDIYLSPSITRGE